MKQNRNQSVSGENIPELTAEGQGCRIKLYPEYLMPKLCI